MKTFNIRSSVFETNSSSTHSISIDKDMESVMDTLKLDEYNNIRLRCRTFDKDEDINNTHDKLVYLILFLIEHSENSFVCSTNREEIFAVVQKQTGCDNIYLDNFDISLEYIDSLSSEDFHDLFIGGYSHEKLRQFIFNKKYILNIDAH